MVYYCLVYWHLYMTFVCMSRVEGIVQGVSNGTDDWHSALVLSTDTASIGRGKEKAQQLKKTCSSDATPKRVVHRTRHVIKVLSTATTIRLEVYLTSFFCLFYRPCHCSAET